MLPVGIVIPVPSYNLFISLAKPITFLVWYWVSGGIKQRVITTNKMG